MQNITVKRYSHPKSTGWAGWVEPEDKSWIVYIGLDGRPMVFLNRDPVSGAILPDDPTEREQHLIYLRSEDHKGQHIGESNDGSAINPEGELSPLEVGETIFPLGESGGGGDVIPRLK